MGCVTSQGWGEALDESHLHQHLIHRGSRRSSEGPFLGQSGEHSRTKSTRYFSSFLGPRGLAYFPHPFPFPTPDFLQHSYLRACMHAKSLQLCPTLCDPMDSNPPRLLCSWDSLGKITGVSSHSLLQGSSPPRD